MASQPMPIASRFRCLPIAGRAMLIDELIKGVTKELMPVVSRVRSRVRCGSVFSTQEEQFTEATRSVWLVFNQVNTGGTEGVNFHSCG